MAATVSPFAGSARGVSTFAPPVPRLRSGSLQQDTIWSALLESDAHQVVEARAGCGKSSTCREGMHRLAEAEPGLRLAYVAFNKSIADEFQAGLPLGAKATTMHSAGFAALRRAFPSLGEPNRQKLRGIADRLMPGRDQRTRRAKTAAIRLAEACKAQLLGMDPASERDGLNAATAVLLASAQGIDLRGLPFEAIRDLVSRLLQAAMKETASVDFGDMVWLPVMLGLSFDPVDVLFVDECLPSWTPVLLADGTSKSIGEIVDNKLPIEVLGYDTETGQQRACKVIGWSRTLNRKPLVKIKVRWNRKKGTSQPTNFIVCTVDHKVWADGRWIMAGEIQPGMTVQVETSAEKRQKGKITSKGRMALAGMISARNASGTMGHPHRESPGPPIRGGNGTGSSLAEGLLFSSLGPRWVMQHVIATGKRKEGYPHHYKIDIANLESKIAVEVDGHSHGTFERKASDRRKDEFLRSAGWKVIRVTNREAIQQTDNVTARIMASDCPIGATVVSVEPVEIADSFVYDITVEGCHDFYANGILVHNCQDLDPCQHALVTLMAGEGRMAIVGDPRQAIYSFRGADARSMGTLGRQLAATPRGVDRHPLTATRRCPASHVELAAKIVPDFESLPGAPRGRWEQNADPASVVEPGWMVLSRKNAPLVGMAFRLVGKGIPVAVQGRDIGEGLARFVDDLEGVTVAELLRSVESYRSAELAKLSDLDDVEEEIGLVNDRADCVRAASEGCSFPAEVSGKVRSLFKDVAKADQSSFVLFSSIHRAKGREAERVAILDPQGMPSPFARTPEGIEQELNMLYVGITRSKHRLAFLGPLPLPLA